MEESIDRDIDRICIQRFRSCQTTCYLHINIENVIAKLNGKLIVTTYF